MFVERGIGKLSDGKRPCLASVVCFFFQFDGLLHSVHGAQSICIITVIQRYTYIFTVYIRVFVGTEGGHGRKCGMETYTDSCPRQDMVNWETHIHNEVNVTSAQLR